MYHSVEVEASRQQMIAQLKPACTDSAQSAEGFSAGSR
jgi:hypothetical protein